MVGWRVGGLLKSCNIYDVLMESKDVLKERGVGGGEWLQNRVCVKSKRIDKKDGLNPLLSSEARTWSIQIILELA